VALRGHVLLVGGLMARTWLHLRPVEDIRPRATADVDLGVDRRGLRLTSSSEKVRPLLQDQGYRPLGGDEGFRFQKNVAQGEALIIDVFVAKGASREEPPLLEKGLVTLAAPGLTYALERGPHFVEVDFADAGWITTVELPLPTLDAAFVLKGALAASGVRSRPDRRDSDRIDALLLAAACLNDHEAVSALARARNREALAALAWLRSSAADPRSAVARTLDRYLGEVHAVEGGAEWAADVATRLLDAVQT